MDDEAKTIIPEDKLAELKATYPKGAYFAKSGVAIFCKKASRPQRIAFLSAVMTTEGKKEERRALAIEKLVRAICVFPDAMTLDKLYEDEGFVLDEIGGEIMEWLRGGEDKVEVKKF